MKSRENLYLILEKYRRIEQYLEDSDGDMSEDVLSDLEITESTKDEALKNVFYLFMEKEEEVMGLEARIEKLNELLDKKKKTMTSLKKLITYAVDYFGDMKIDEFNLSVKESKATDCTMLEREIKIEQDDIDPVYQLDVAYNLLDDKGEKVLDLVKKGLVRLKIIPVPNKVEILKDLKAGRQVYACDLKTNKNLNIK